MKNKILDKPKNSIEVLEYEAPFLIEKLLKDSIINSTDEGKMLFLELKKWLFIIQNNNSKTWEMYSIRIDEVWHQFILYTEEYFKFCKKYFGKYIHHNPSNAPLSEKDVPTSIGTFDEFSEVYKSIFQMPLPNLWNDETGISNNSRIINDKKGKCKSSIENDEISIYDFSGNKIFSANLIAEDSINFILNTGAFYVRELPGNILSSDENVSLVSTLIECGLLKIGS